MKSILEHLGEPDADDRGGRRRVGFKKKPGISHLAGTVKEIRMGSEYGPPDADADTVAHVTVSHGRRKPKDKHDYPPERTSHFHMAAEAARKLKIGQKVRVHVEPL